ncbi:MAG TPA: class I SAM-dependent methyltransferase [Candidatus Saccharimonadia bacterium]|nr:class I SAM-dependent methyltransferase [Candidatus Saccharimonadia bacterium]
MSLDPDTAPSHWRDVYRRVPPDAVSWFRPRLDVSLELLAHAGFGAGSTIIDVGGGASTLVDDCLALGASHVTVVDLADEALAIARQRVGDDPRVTWRIGDILAQPAPDHHDYWHDRAVLHFLDDDAAAAYARNAALALSTGAHAVIAGFAPDGPPRCSGLPVVRRDAAAIAEVLGDAFELVDTRAELHRTPGGAAQSFAYALLRRR